MFPNVSCQLVGELTLTEIDSPLSVMVPV